MRRRLLGALSLVLPLSAVAEPRPSHDLLPEGTSIIAHRGFSSQAPENTMAAFERAVSLGVGFELDVTLSADGEVVVIHDDTLDRTTSGAGAVRELPWDRIASLDAGSWYDSTFAGEPVPLLRDVLDRFGGQVPIDIELKTYKPRSDLAAAVVKLVRDAGLTDRVFVTSFDPYLLEEVRKREPRIRRGQLTSHFRESDLNLVEKLFLRNLWLNGRSQPDFIVADHEIISRGFLRRIHKRGFRLYCYTVDEPARMRQLRDLGIDGIITNVPDVGMQVMAE